VPHFELGRGWKVIVFCVFYIDTKNNVKYALKLCIFYM
jgi:hypothetical protein